MKNYFQKAKVYQTRGIANEAEGDRKFKGEVNQALHKFFIGDWGIVNDEDKQANIEALQYFDRVLGAYMTSKGKIWISGESHNGTYYDIVIVLFPKEY